MEVTFYFLNKDRQEEKKQLQWTAELSSYYMQEIAE